MSQYRTIYYPKMLYESLRNYYSINSDGQLSVLYKILLCCLWPLQLRWNDYETFRQNKLIIANTKWQLGQLTNVLNYLFTTTEIYITQAVQPTINVPTIFYESETMAPTITYESDVKVPTIDNAYNIIAIVTIHVPTSIYTDSNKMSELVSIIEQIIITGITYNIVEI